MSDVLYIGVGSHVVAIQASTGQELWRTPLKRTSFVTITVRRDAIYAGAAGHLFCLDPSTGHVRWKNSLDGLGLGLIAFGDTVPAAAAAAAQAAAGAAAASA
jgi:outer membrane protein assembly factor BamB